jgi:hypothetical protein
MASNQKQNVRSYQANGTIKAYSFVKFDTTAPASAKNPRVVACASGKADGISQNDVDAALGDFVEVAFPGGGAKLTISGSVNPGQSLKATTSGYGIVTTTAGDHVSARSVEGGASGDIIGVNVINYEKYNADAT